MLLLLYHKIFLHSDISILVAFIHQKYWLTNTSSYGKFGAAKVQIASLSSNSLHLELVTDRNTESFLACLKYFMAAEVFAKSYNPATIPILGNSITICGT